jgi:hypothetical protein
MIKFHYVVELLVSSLATVCAIGKDYKCGCGPHLYHPATTGIDTIYQLLEKPVYIIANVTEGFDRVRWGVSPGTSTLREDDINSLRMNRVVETLSHYMGVTLPNKSLDGIEVFARLVDSKGHPTLDKKHIHYVSIRSGEPPSVIVETHSCKRNFSLCVNLTGTPRPSVIKTYSHVSRQFLTSHQRTRFCATFHRSATSTISKINFVVSNCFGDVFIVITVSRNPPIISSCEISHCIGLSSTSCTIAGITVSINSTTSINNCSMPDAIPTDSSERSSSPVNSHPSSGSLSSSPPSSAATHSTSAVRKPISYNDTESSTPSWSGTSAPNAVSRDQTENTSSPYTGSSYAQSRKVTPRTTNLPSPLAFGSLSISTEGLPIFIAAAGAVVLFVLTCPVLWLWKKKRKHNAAKYCINKQKDKKKKRLESID